MLAVLDKREGRAVHTILQEIAQTYPQVRDILHTIAQNLWDKCLVSIVKQPLHENCPWKQSFSYVIAINFIALFT